MPDEFVTVIGVASVAVVSITSTRLPTASWPTALAIHGARARAAHAEPDPHIDLFFTILLPLFLILSSSGSSSAGRSRFRWTSRG